MKNLSVPTLSTDSLGNSLFECVTFDKSAYSGDNDPSKPKLVRAGVICLCLRGGGTFVINETTYNVEKGSVITILPNTLVEVIQSSDDFLGYVIAASTEFMMKISMADVLHNYIYISDNPVLRIGESQANAIIELGEMLKRKRDEVDHPFSKEIAQQLLLVLCYEISALYRKSMNEMQGRDGGRSRQSALCHDFLVLVDKHAHEYRDMGYYADRLCITPKYLSVVVRKVSGRSPVEWIDQTVMRYARTLLTSSDLTVQQISAELNFPNPSFFGQYFKRHEEITPKQFRTKIRG